MRLIALSALALLAFATAAHGQEKATLQYKLSVGGLNAGTFSQATIPSHTVMLAQNDVKVVPKVQDIDKNTMITLSDGSVSNMVMKILKDKVGQQMTVSLKLVPSVAGNGQRCTFTLDHAFLKAYSDSSMKFRLSEMPKFECK